jgi:adenylate cyclase
VARERRKLAAILAAEVVGYSRLMGRDESGTLAHLRAHREQRLEPAIAQYGGRLVKLTGDGALVEFASAVDALSAAIEFQQAVEDSNQQRPEAEKIAFRIGLHLGDMIVDGDDLYGDGVNVAARLEAEASAGGIVVSRTVHEAVAGRLKATFDDLGDLALKNIDRPVQAFGVKWTSADWQRPVAPSAPSPVSASASGDRPPLPDKPSIAVLPFQNMSGDIEQEYFVDGLVEDIITALSRISWFFVIARTSSFTYKGRAVDVREVGRQLGVRYVVEGSVRRSGNRLRITGQLVDTAIGKHVWADRYDGAVEDVFELQDRLTASIVGAIEPKVQQAEIERAQAKTTTDLSAYDLFLRAIALREDYKEEKHREALRLLERAVVLDPGFSSAHALMSNTYMNFKSQGWGSLEEAEEKGLAAARLALETGPDDPLALARAGAALSYLGERHQEALGYIERALTLNPNLAVAWRFAGYTHWYLGHVDAANEHFTTARRYSPVDQAAFDGYVGTALVCISRGEYETALTWADRAVRERPRWAVAHWVHIVATVLAGRPREHVAHAVEQLRQLDLSITVGAIMRRFAAVQAADRTLFETALRESGLPD